MGSGQMGSAGTGGNEPNDGPTDQPNDGPNRPRIDTNTLGGRAAGDGPGYLYRSLSGWAHRWGDRWAHRWVDRWAHRWSNNLIVKSYGLNVPLIFGRCLGSRGTPTLEKQKYHIKSGKRKNVNQQKKGFDV